MSHWKAYDRMGFRNIEEAKTWFGRTFSCRVKVEDPREAAAAAKS